MPPHPKKTPSAQGEGLFAAPPMLFYNGGHGWVFLSLRQLFEKIHTQTRRIEKLLVTRLGDWGTRLKK